MRSLPMLLTFILIGMLFAGAVSAAISDIAPQNTCQASFTQPYLSIAVNENLIQGQLYYYNTTGGDKIGVANAKLKVYIGAALPANQLNSNGDMATGRTIDLGVGTGGSAFFIQTDANGTFSVSVDSIPSSQNLQNNLTAMGADCYLTLKFDPYVYEDNGNLAPASEDCNTLNPPVTKENYAQINYAPPACPATPADEADYLDINPCPCKSGTIPKPLLGAQQLVPYCIAKKALAPTIQTIPLSDQCLPVFLILGLLGGAMFLQGKNPMASFDFSSPRLQRGQQYQMRTQSKNIALGGLFMSATGYAQQKNSVKGQAAMAAQKATGATVKAGVTNQVANQRTLTNKEQKTVDKYNKLVAGQASGAKGWAAMNKQVEKKQLTTLTKQVSEIRRKSGPNAQTPDALKQEAERMGLVTGQVDMTNKSIVGGLRIMDQRAKSKQSPKVAEMQDRAAANLRKQVGSGATNQQLLRKQAENEKTAADAATKAATKGVDMKQMNRDFISNMLGTPASQMGKGGPQIKPKTSKSGAEGEAKSTELKSFVRYIPVVNTIAGMAKNFTSPDSIKAAFKGGFKNEGAQTYAAQAAGMTNPQIMRGLAQDLPYVGEVYSFMKRYDSVGDYMAERLTGGGTVKVKLGTIGVSDLELGTGKTQEEAQLAKIVRQQQKQMSDDIYTVTGQKIIAPLIEPSTAAAMLGYGKGSDGVAKYMQEYVKNVVEPQLKQPLTEAQRNELMQRMAADANQSEGAKLNLIRNMDMPEVEKKIVELKGVVDNSEAQLRYAREATVAQNLTTEHLLRDKPEDLAKVNETAAKYGLPEWRVLELVAARQERDGWTGYLNELKPEDRKTVDKFVADAGKSFDNLANTGAAATYKGTMDGLEKAYGGEKKLGAEAKELLHNPETQSDFSLKLSFADKALQDAKTVVDMTKQAGSDAPPPIIYDQKTGEMEGNPDFNNAQDLTNAISAARVQLGNASDQFVEGKKDAGKEKTNKKGETPKA